MQVELITELERLEGLRSRWDELCDAGSLTLSTSALCIAWYRHRLPDGVSPHVWVVSRDEVPLGIVPMVAQNLVGGDVQVFPAGTGAVFGVVPVAEPACQDAVASAWAEAVADPLASVALVRLDAVPEDSAWSRALDRVAAPAGWQRVDLRREESPFVDLSEGYDTWFETRRSSFRKSSRRRRRRLEEAGLQDVCTDDPESLVDVVPAIRRVYNTRTVESGEDRYGFDDSFAAMLEEAFGASEPGRFQFTGLSADGVIQAFNLSIQAGRWVADWLTGFDSSIRTLGPGKETMLIGLRSRAKTCDFVELGIGGQPYKADMKSGDRVLVTAAWCTRRARRALFAFAPS